MPKLNLKKFRVGKEKAQLNAWLWKEHKTDIQWRNVRLGVLPTKELAKAYMSMLRYADAIYLKDGIVHIVEAKLRPNFGIIGQLEGYQMLFKQTPEFMAYQNWPIKLQILSSIMDIPIAQMASDKNMDFIVFTMKEVNKTRAELGQQVIPLDDVLS
jgi:hypothetical protein